MLPDSWLDFVFPNELRAKSDWIDPYGRSRRTYLLGFAQASYAVGRPLVDSLFRERSPTFKEDPRRHVPLIGWRDRFHYTGELFVEGAAAAPRYVEGQTYLHAPHDPLRAPCTKWGAYGKDQPEHAFQKRPMRLYDALKSITALFDARDQTGRSVAINPSPDGRHHSTGEISMHVAIFHLPGFDQTYYEEHFGSNPTRLAALFEHCELHPRLMGEHIPTFAEMARGMSATRRTCDGLIAFCKKHKLPSLGALHVEYGPRGRLRNRRSAIKRETRTGIFYKYSADCAIEVFVL